MDVAGPLLRLGPYFVMDWCVVCVPPPNPPLPSRLCVFAPPCVVCCVSSGRVLWLSWWCPLVSGVVWWGFRRHLLVRVPGHLRAESAYAGGGVSPCGGYGSSLGPMIRARPTYPRVHACVIGRIVGVRRRAHSSLANVSLA